MIEQINQELLKLQDELNKFNGAVGHIAKAGELSDNLIESSKSLQKSFSEHMGKIEVLFSEYMNKTYSHTEEKINNIFAAFKDRMQQEENSIEKFSQLTTQNEKLSQQTLSKISEQNTKLIEQFVKEAQATLEEEKDYAKLQIENINIELKKITDEHREKLQKEQQVLDNYVELASATAELSKHLKSVNFPKRLDTIAKSVELTNNNIINANEKIEKLEENDDKLISNTQKLIDDKTALEIFSAVRTIQNDKKPQETLDNINKTNKKLKTTKFLVILIFIFSIIFYSFMAFIFFTLFPHFFEDMF